MSDFKINSIATKQGQHGPVIAGVSTINSTGCMKIPSGPTEFRGGRGRNVTYGGNGPTYLNSMNVMEISTAGSAVDFGDASDNNGFSSGMGSSTRGVVAGGVASPTRTNTIDFITIATTGNASDFGDLSTIRRTCGSSDVHGGLGD